MQHVAATIPMLSDGLQQGAATPWSSPNLSPMAPVSLKISGSRTLPTYLGCTPETSAESTLRRRSGLLASLRLKARLRSLALYF